MNKQTKDFLEIERLKAEIERLKGELERLKRHIGSKNNRPTN
jgi:peptidoglycan hydrolase CwlO-like protein